eukprot:CAMPEP_0172317420 /NCGR_PEP_ID=MMETSP1058-20130122/31539_1 /TAXON_ID=83371 /ORGANISM="Detonula confervacea, Strain CCMP 353" /LENGTH=50 /DNA_ID=CAMNT_0013031973 /DNA_START=296 /DNA_END=444 /DNA_ORIENTATION=-
MVPNDRDDDDDDAAMELPIKPPANMLGYNNSSSSKRSRGGTRSRSGNQKT